MQNSVTVNNYHADCDKNPVAIIDYDDFILDVQSFCDAVSRCVVGVCVPSSSQTVTWDDTVCPDSKNIDDLIHRQDNIVDSVNILHQARKEVNNWTCEHCESLKKFKELYETVNQESDDAANNRMKIGETCSESTASLPLKLFNQYFSMFASFLKPRIGSTSFMTRLKQNGYKCVFVSSAFEHVNDYHNQLVNGFEELPMNPFENELLHICSSSLNELRQLLETYSTDAIICTSRKTFSKLFRDLGFNRVAISRSNRETLVASCDDFDWTQINLENMPIKYLEKVAPLRDLGPQSNLERHYWANCLAFTNYFKIDGKIVRGFGRGSSLLGIPTANLDSQPERFYKVLSDRNPVLFLPGVYYGWASFDEKDDDEWKNIPMVTSIGYNPFYINKSISVEPHFFEVFSDSLLGMRVSLNIVGMIRVEANFPVFGQLLHAIQNDCAVARSLLLKSKQT